MSDSILDLEVDQKVEQFAEGIREWIISRFPDREITMRADRADSEDGERHAQRVYIKTDFGVVIVMPDFNHRSAAACTVNIGMVKGMAMEGFTDEQIDNEGRIYSTPVKFTESSIEVLGYYLTHKIFSTK